MQKQAETQPGTRSQPVPEPGPKFSEPVQPGPVPVPNFLDPVQPGPVPVPENWTEYPVLLIPSK